MKAIAWITIVTIGLAFAGAASSTELKVPKEKSLQTQSQIKLVISDQISAFLSLDVDRAYEHASSSIKAIFPNSKIFGTMVKKSYPMIWNPKSYQFLSTVYNSNVILQRMMFKDQQDTMHFFDYALENNGERWLITGVYLVKGEQGV